MIRQTIWQLALIGLFRVRKTRWNIAKHSWGVQRKGREGKDAVAKIYNNFTREMALFGLIFFYGISTIVGYFMPNPLYTYIINI